MSDIRVASIPWETAKAARDIRQQVFIDEQRVPADLEWDDQDAVATHFLLYLNDQPVGTARLLNDGHIGRVAIMPAQRGQGLGEALMRHIVEHATQQGIEELVLSAQVHALPFYRRLGFETCSEEYLEAGIPHRDMRRAPS